MLELTFVRHGETDGNKKQLYQGWTNTPLNEIGIWQAERLAQRFKQQEFDCIYSSPLSRSLKTASIINRYHGLKIHEVKHIKEINFGEWENMSRYQLEELYPNHLQEWRNDWKKFVIPGGESLEIAYERITSWLDRFIKDKDQGKVLIVSHAGAIRAMVSRLVGRGIEGHWNYMVNNCSISCIKIFDGFPVMTLLNDTSYLKEGESQ